MYIHSKRRKLGTFTLFQKCHFAYPFKQSNSPPIRKFPSFSIFGHVTCHVIIIKREGARKPTFGENSFYSVSLSEKYCQSFIRFEHTFNPGLKDVSTAYIPRSFCFEKGKRRSNFLDLKSLGTRFKMRCIRPLIWALRLALHVTQQDHTRLIYLRHSRFTFWEDSAMLRE